MEPNTCIVWEQFFYYECEQLAAKFLQNTFEERGIPKAKALAYQTAPKLAFAIRQANEYYRAAESANLLIKPLLCFYGMACLVRALLVKHQPDYPSSVSVLKHGLSSRKLKRTGFQIINDVAVIQRAGLYVEFHNLLHRGEATGTIRKYRVGDLLGIIPDINNSFFELGVPCSVIPIQLEQLDHDGLFVWSIPSSYFRSNNWTLAEHIAYFNQLDSKNHSTTAASNERFKLADNASPGTVKLTRTGRHQAHPLLSSDLAGSWFLRFPPSDGFILHEMSAHYMIMFLLGMLCRYETERWGEIVLGGFSCDAYIIQKFLSMSLVKFPQMVLSSLQNDSSSSDHQ